MSRKNKDRKRRLRGHAEILLERGELERIPDVFKGAFDLKAMYSERDVFHITELTATCYFMIRYMVRKDQLESAAVYLRMLRTTVPNHPATRASEGVIEGANLKRLAKAMASRMLRMGRLP